MSNYNAKCKNSLPIIFDDNMPVTNLTPKVVNRVNNNTEDLKNLYDETESQAEDIETLQEDLEGKIDVPQTAGTAGQVLTSDGEGGAVWASVGAGEVVVDPTLIVAGAAADAKVTGDEITHLKQDINELEAGGYVADQQRIEEKIDAWLDNHPEATTTVQDGSLTEAKFSNTLKLATIKNYVTPEMFGAVGDGVTDDSTAFQRALNSGLPVCITNGSIIRINGNVAINNATTIFGFGNGSKLRIYGSIITDSDDTHTLEMFGFCLECYKTTGTALIINKTNNSSAKNALSIHDMVFYHHNNVSSSLDSVVMSIKGIRESSIVNCVFKGDSSTYGTAILFEADSTHMTMNITIAECNFYSIGTFVKLSNDLENYIYLAGIRLINNMYIAGSAGVDASYVDTLFIADSMFDFVLSPIKIDSCGVIKIHHNYIQTTTGQCIYLINTKASECRLGEITNNFVWSTTQGHVVDGIVFNGGTGKFTFWTISGNKCTALDTMITMSNCQNCEVKDNIAHDTTTFFDGNSNSTIITIRDNKADVSVTNFNLNTHASCYISDGNMLGTKLSRARGKYISSGDGTTFTFRIPHGLMTTPVWAVASSGYRANGAFGISYDSTNIIVNFATPPENGTNNVLIHWEAAISDR